VKLILEIRCELMMLENGGHYNGFRQFIGQEWEGIARSIQDRYSCHENAYVSKRMH